MTYSMTAFARHAVEGKHGHYIWEIRSVNHRYCELFIRLPDEMRGLESHLREQFADRIKRGKVDCSMRFEAKTIIDGELLIDQAQVKQIGAACEQIGQQIGNLSPLTAIDILKWPGVIASEKTKIEDLEQEALNGFADALQQLLETRQREGDKMAAIIQKRCDSIAVLVDEMRGRVPEIIRSIRGRYEQRIAEFVDNLEPSRVEQECALLMQKLDVEEELDRLTAHLSEVSRVLKASQPAGRRLDFLMQELNREANTLGSKSAHIDTSNASIDLKVLIEQMREQIQNIE